MQNSSPYSFGQTTHVSKKSPSETVASWSCSHAIACFPVQWERKRYGRTICLFPCRVGELLRAIRKNDGPPLAPERKKYKNIVRPFRRLRYHPKRRSWVSFANQPLSTISCTTH